MNKARYILNIFKESINDKNLFKAIFIAGAGGSGKSFVVDQMFQGLGTVPINSDLPFEYLLDKVGLSKVIADENTELYKKQMFQRSIAKGMLNQRVVNWLNGMLPVVIDGTGKDYDEMKQRKEIMENLGYDTSLIFVDTLLDVALERNSMREREVRPDIIIDAWKQVQNNKAPFKQLFGKDFYLIDNSKTYLTFEELKEYQKYINQNKDRIFKGKTEEYIKALDRSKESFKNYEEVTQNLRKLGMKILQEPLSNKLGNSILNQLKQNNGKYLSDLNIDTKNTLVI